MSEGRSVSAEVEVAVDAPTAFSAFTEEMDRWWVRGPINFFDASRAVAMTCEPGVGGRILEVYDEAAGDALELGRITVWQPGERVCWQSSVDDVVIEVHFEPLANGTRVCVDGIVPDGKIADAGLDAAPDAARRVPRVDGTIAPPLVDLVGEGGERRHGVDVDVDGRGDVHRFFASTCRLNERSWVFHSAWS